MAIWRLHTNTSWGDIAEYCIQNHVAALGWSLEKIQDAIRGGIVTFEDYCEQAKEQYDSKFGSVRRLKEETKEDDLIWLRKQGLYYIARVTSESKWIFCHDAVEKDAANQLTNINWYKVPGNADEGSVPGAITTSFIMGAAFQRINKKGIEQYSQLLYNLIPKDKSDSFTYPNTKLSLCDDMFYNLLQPSDVEDLLALWLYVNKGYVCIPSTNKLGTPVYECVLIDPKSPVRHHVYIQAKKGNDNLDADDYSHLPGDVYLLTTKGKIINVNKHENVFEVNPSVIYEFAINPNNAHIIPEHICYWVDFLRNNS